MPRLDEIDQNLKVETSLDEKNIRFYDVRRTPFSLHGFCGGVGGFRRLPEDVAEAANDGVKLLATNTAGGRVRFSTDSSYVAIKAVMKTVTNFPHMTLAGSSGFDLFVENTCQSRYAGTFMPPVGMTDGYESILYFQNRGQRSLTIDFPLYNDVSALYVGLEEGASIGPGEAYRFVKPVVYYGSSITQGGCASRPGNSYQAIIARRLNADYINLGFSGSAHGENVLAEYIASLGASVFVCDYDHNAPDAAYLAATHARFFETVRAGAPLLPVIFVTRPDYERDPAESADRRAVIHETFINARRRGDRKVWFVDGERLFGEDGYDVCTVDGVHPNDAGFVRMARVIGDAVARALETAD